MSKSLFFATPAYGGMITVEYAQSQLASTIWLMQNEVPFGWYFISNESLINRARNRCVHDFLQTNATHLLFVDADIGFTTADLVHLMNQNVPVVGGTYPSKSLPIRLNFNPLDEHKTDSGLQLKLAEGYKAWCGQFADESGMVEVKHLPTGFMMIERSVFETLKDKVDSYEFKNLGTGKMETHRNYFPVYVKDGILLSEDWAWCELCRTNNIPVYLNTNVVLRHFGSFSYSAEIT